MMSRLLWLLPLLSGCVLADLDLSTKACPCGDGLICDEVNNVCVTALEPSDAGMIRDASLPPDSGIPERCVRDRDCGNDICEDSRCRPRCDAQNAPACPNPAVCDRNTGRCLRTAEPCAVASDCTQGPPTQVCINGFCEWGCPVRNHECVPSRQCDLTTGACGPRQPCTTDDECGDPLYVCTSGGYCAARCDAPDRLATPCFRDSTCEPSGRCSLNSIGEICESGADCATGVCLVIFFGGEQFPFCTETCGSTTDCPIGTPCGEQLGGANACVIGASIGRPDGPFDGAAGSSCAFSANDVCHSSKCVEGACVEGCTKDADCETLGFADTFTCQGEAFLTPDGIATQTACKPQAPGLPPGSACLDNTDCQSGLCDPESGVCVITCCGELDCQRNENCVLGENFNRVCQTSTQAAAGALLNAPCTRNSDCASNICSLDTPRFTPVCSTFCCTQEDCRILGDDARCVIYTGPLGGVASICIKPRPE